MDKAVFLVDAGYLSFISKFLGNGRHLRFKIEDFAINLFERSGLECESIYYYTAPPYQSPKPSEEENKRKAKYDKFIGKLKLVNNPKVIIREGRCQKSDDGFSQKGVDTLITMDLMKISAENKIKKIVLLSADTDFVPVIEDIRKNEKVQVYLAYFTDRKRKSPFSLSNHLWNVCDDKILIKREYFET